MVKPITKYATSVSDPLAVRSTLLKAIFYARNGRPGPVWIDIPIDVQGSLVEENELERYLEPDFTAAQRDPDVAPNTLGDFKALCGDSLATVATEIVARLQKAKRPVVFAGAGIRIAGCYSQFLALIEDMQVPVVCGFNAHDLLPNDHALYAGRPGTIGDRPGNFSVQNADFLLILGCRLNIRQISYNWQSFAPKAWKVHVDIDPSELEKHTLKTDMKVHADLRHFLPAMSKQLQSRGAAPQVHAEYLAWCRERVSRYPVVQQAYLGSRKVNPYVFMDELFRHLSAGDSVVVGNATACIASFQAGKIIPELRLYSNSGSASMGYDLPAAIGAAFGGASRVICLAGDGSIMMNLQELQTIVGYQLPVKIFVLNNNGYHSIRQTQNAYFSDSLIGIDAATGVTFPDFCRVAAGFGFEPLRITHHKQLADRIEATLAATGPTFCEVVLDETQEFAPKLSSRKLPDGTMVSPSLEDMAPFLSRDELAENILPPT